MRIGALRWAWGRPRAADAPLPPRGTSTHALKARYLSAIDVFRDLNSADLDHLAHSTTMITTLKGRVIYRPGETNEALFLLKRGRVQVVRESADGKRLVTAVLAPNTFFGEMALIGQRFPQDSAAEALEDSVICVLSRRDLERLVMEHPKVGLRFLEQVSARLVETEAAMEDFAFKPVAGRLAGALLRLTEGHEQRTVNASHQELADVVATHRETVTLTLSHFREQGLVELGRRSIRVLDPDGLEAIAAG